MTPFFFRYWSVLYHCILTCFFILFFFLVLQIPWTEHWTDVVYAWTTLNEHQQVISYTANLSWTIILTYHSTFYAKFTRMVLTDTYVNDNAKSNIHTSIISCSNIYIIATVSFQNNQLLYLQYFISYTFL